MTKPTTKRPAPTPKVGEPDLQAQVQRLTASVTELSRRTRIVLDSFEQRIAALESVDHEAQMLRSMLESSRQSAVKEALAMERLARQVQEGDSQEPME